MGADLRKMENNKTAYGFKIWWIWKNTPKDGVIDRIQVVQYPSKIGYLEPHIDPNRNQRLFFSGYMSKQGVDFKGLGFYLIGSGNKIVEVEQLIDAGDVGIGYSTVYHGVAPVNENGNNKSKSLLFNRIWNDLLFLKSIKYRNLLYRSLNVQSGL